MHFEALQKNEQKKKELSVSYGRVIKIMEL